METKKQFEVKDDITWSAETDEKWDHDGMTYKNITHLTVDPEDNFYLNEITFKPQFWKGEGLKMIETST